MPSAIEQAYVEQGYRHPGELNWDAVERHRAAWDIDPILVPVAVGPGCIGWGVPFIDGKPLSIRDTVDLDRTWRDRPAPSASAATRVQHRAPA